MQGLHLIADLHECTCPTAVLLDQQSMEIYCVEACQRNGLTVVGRLFHTFQNENKLPAGVTGTVVLAESHLAIHTWPEVRGVTLDVYVCNYSGDNSTRARNLFAEIITRFAPDRLETKEVARGHLNT